MPRPRKQLIEVLRHAENALLDYVDRLERGGSTMGYGRGVLAIIRMVLEAEKVSGTSSPGAASSPE